MDKVNSKKNDILNKALPLVRKLGFESVSIANLAKEVGMSKSGLFAHFNSKEKMHLMILDHAAVSFTQSVIVPALSSKRGLPRLKKLLKNWLDWLGESKEGTCPFVVASIEYDQKPGEVKDRLQFHLNSLIKAIRKSVELCIEEGDFKADRDSENIAFEIYSLIIGYQVYRKTLNHKNAKKILLSSIENLYQRNS